MTGIISATWFLEHVCPKWIHNLKYLHFALMIFIHGPVTVRGWIQPMQSHKQVACEMGICVSSTSLMKPIHQQQPRMQLEKTVFLFYFSRQSLFFLNINVFMAFLCETNNWIVMHCSGKALPTENTWSGISICQCKHQPILQKSTPP